MSNCLACYAAGGCGRDFDNPHHYEAHITVEYADVEEFIAACKDIGVKPVVLDLQKRTGGMDWKNNVEPIIFQKRC